jgi:hypothetical protein
MNADGIPVRGRSRAARRAASPHPLHPANARLKHFRTGTLTRPSATFSRSTREKALDDQVPEKEIQASVGSCGPPQRLAVEPYCGISAMRSTIESRTSSAFAFSAVWWLITIEK